MVVLSICRSKIRQKLLDQCQVGSLTPSAVSELTGVTTSPAMPQTSERDVTVPLNQATEQ